MAEPNPDRLVAAASARQPRIDAHVHLWRYDPARFAWIDSPRSALRRDFLPEDLQPLLAASALDGAIAVQATETLEETQWLLQCMAAQPALVGVVGWVPLGDPAVAGMLDALATDGLLGVREMLQDRPAGALGDPALSRGLRQLTARGLCFDLLLRADQLGEAAALVELHPDQMFVLDHAGKPPLAAGDLRAWERAIRSLALHPNVVCKFSGLVTEAPWDSWTTASLEPVLNTCVEAFGTTRLLAGSDWPVCLLASSYGRWQEVMDGLFSPFSQGERDGLFGANAVRVYRVAAGDAL